MTLDIVIATGDGLEDWRAIHNEIIPTHPLSGADVAERAGRNRLTLGFLGDELVGNATVRPPLPDSSVATVIVRILPEYRRRGLGAAYLSAELTHARELGARRIETVVLASNEDGLAFASVHGFAEHDRYVLPGESIAFIDLHLPAEKS
ncbi:GNAT family N-acetyltransferase [Solicola gregarius]|uniref:GNAT family N-acetyltransferase n=1 Tax=Solicola gregarius TaxID=2908642 RepID=A0AA46TL14_9ACTN|nr:GNAT family N-acetyltransferase [Solicola gregarius]UYM06383.1 GNAT family N-acetyltransferase [Solicola gregarius]